QSFRLSSLVASFACRDGEVGPRRYGAATEPISASTGRHTRARRRRRISERAWSQLAEKNRGGISRSKPVAAERWRTGRATAIAGSTGGPRRQSLGRPAVP